MRLLLALTLALTLLAPAWAQDEDPAPAAPSKDAPGAPTKDDAQAGAPTEAKGKAGSGAVEFRFGYYDNADGKGDGNPFLDEALTDIEVVIVGEYQATDRLRLTLTSSYDNVSSASIDRLSNYPQQSGASADNYFSGDLAAKYEVTEDLRIGGHAGASFEYDYKSFGFGANVELDVADKNATLSMGLNVFFDQVGIIRFNGDEREGDENRTSISVNMGYYQVLSSTVHLSMGYNLTHQTGFLQTAYNGVVLEDPARPASNLDPALFITLTNLPPGVAIEAEELPDTRLRNALFAEIRKVFPDVGFAVGGAGRFYLDTWGIVSFSAEIKLYQWLVRDVLRARFRYRFYTQTAADDYEERFFVPTNQRSNDPLKPLQDRTQDSDLSDFSSHTIGLKFVLSLGKSWTLDLGGDYVLRSDGIDQILFSLGVRWEF
jgi:hypothetical protein